MKSLGGNPLKRAEPRLVVPEDRIPRCGHCHYVVRGITELICPECGNDLREVGIDVGKRSPTPWITLTMLLIGWCCAMILVAPICFAIVVLLTPNTVTLTSNATYSKPDSGGFLTIAVKATADVKSGKTEPNSGPSGDMILTRADGTLAVLTFADGQIVRTSGFNGVLDPAHIASWLSTMCGIPVDQKLLNEASTVWAGATTASTYGNVTYSQSGIQEGGFGSVTKTSTSTPRHNANLYGQLATVVVWLLGCVGLIRSFLGPTRRPSSRRVVVT